MNLKNLTSAMMTGLTYEIVLKLGRLSAPFFFKTAPVPGITSLLSFLVGILIILFLLSFYREERSDKSMGFVLQLIIGCVILHFILRWPVPQRLADSQAVRLSGEIRGSIQAMFLFLPVGLYQKQIPSDETQLSRATVALTVLFGIGILTSLYSLVSYTRFVLSGIETQFPAPFLALVSPLFFFTHSTMIYFLWRYFQLKFGKRYEAITSKTMNGTRPQLGTSAGHGVSHHRSVGPTGRGGRRAGRSGWANVSGGADFAGRGSTRFWSPPCSPSHCSWCSAGVKP